MRNSYQNTTNYTQNTNTEKLVLVRSNILYGLIFESVKQEKISYNSGITSIPNIIFFNNNTECFIDFTNQNNEEIEVKVESFFSKIAPGTTFYIFNGEYKDAGLEETGDISGEFVFEEFFKGIIRATVTSVTSIIPNVIRYDKKFFIDTPIISVNAFSNSETKSVTTIRNVFGYNTKNSFTYMGVSIGDYVSFSGIDGKYEILEVSKEPNGSETLKIKGIIPAQTKTESKILVSTYIKFNERYTILPNLLEVETGACVKNQNYGIGGQVTIGCFDNQTVSQCRFRSSIEQNVTTTFFPGTSCVTPETETAKETTTTDKLVQITNILASNIASANNSISSISGPINRNGNSRTSFYGRG